MVINENIYRYEIGNGCVSSNASILTPLEYYHVHSIIIAHTLLLVENTTLLHYIR